MKLTDAEYNVFIEYMTKKILFYQNELFKQEVNIKFVCNLILHCYKLLLLFISTHSKSYEKSKNLFLLYDISCNIVIRCVYMPLELFKLVRHVKSHL